MLQAVNTETSVLRCMKRGKHNSFKAVIAQEVFHYISTHFVFDSTAPC